MLISTFVDRFCFTLDVTLRLALYFLKNIKISLYKILKVDKAKKIWYKRDTRKKKGEKMLNEIMTKKKMTTQELADKTKIKKRTLDNYRSGRR